MSQPETHPSSTYVKQPQTTPYPVSDFLEWYMSKQLELAPKFQRRSVWEPKAKSYLIDSIVRGMPIPPLFIRLRLDPVKQRSIREVVDGQQRLRTVLDYIHGEFPISAVHNPDLAGCYYTDLPDDIRARILSYKFPVTTLEDITDADVLAIFARLNTYTVRLNAQELRNAEFFGAFKQVIYELALEHYSFWASNKIFSDQQIARMDEAEFASELVVTMLDGIRQTRADDLRGFYKEYDDQFDRSQEVKEQFRDVIDTVGEILGSRLAGSFSARKPVFYSLFVAVFDGLYGLPKSKRSRIQFNAARVKNVRQRLERLNGLMRSPDELEGAERQFYEDARYATADIGRRRRRHEFMWDTVIRPPK